MDTGLLNLEEHFSTFHAYQEPDDPSNSGDNFRTFYNEWEDERELNGDIGLIPESSNFSESLKDITDLADSPPSLLFQKMIDWSAYVYVDGVDTFSHEPIQLPLPDQNVESNSEVPTELNTNFDDNFDLATYLDDGSVFENKPKVKSVGKRIDKEAQRYIIEEKDDNLDTSDEIDVETVSENASLPVLEANDAFSLLEQFEASEKPILPSSKSRDNLDDFGFSNTLANINLAVNQIPSSPMEIFEKIPQAPIDIFEDDVKNQDIPIKEPNDTNEVTEQKNKVVQKPEIKQEAIIPPKPQTSDTNTSQNYTKSKHILEALPQELIARINESGKRKTITVIPPIPNKKRSASRSVDNTSQHRNKIPKTSNNDQIQLEHDYCAATSPYPKDPHKDSGFQSEEDDRSVIRNQPTVKTADGKLMVSLLKVNTIRNNNLYLQKKKLNLEEYKKRRFINSNATSQSNSPASSTCSSPLPEDENLKRIKHQEKLMKMAADLLNTPAKSSKTPDSCVRPAKPPVPDLPPKAEPAPVASIITPPPELEVKTYVSIATNTDISSINSTKSLIASTKQLEEIKPLLKKVSDKINSNSFITSLIENIPKTKTKVNTYVRSENQEVVREDKIIHYLEKDRAPVKTKNAGSQTDFDEVVNVDSDSESRYRRRLDASRSPSSSSSGSSCHSVRRRRRSSSNSSRRSRSSRSSDSSSSTSSRSSRSRSRSISPRRQRQLSAEHVREVEERRVVFVGRLVDGTSKEDLRRRFIRFGPITNVSLHFREYGDNYGFVTFANKEDAYNAKEHGNDHMYPKYDLSFGGRRIFCKTTYADLDNVCDDEYRPYASRPQENSFDALLRAAQEKLRKRKP